MRVNYKKYNFLLFQYFKRDADELESWILEKTQAASDESYKDPTNLQVIIINYVLKYLNR